MGNQIKQTVTNIHKEQLDQIDRNQKNSNWIKQTVTNINNE